MHASFPAYHRTHGLMQHACPHLPTGAGGQEGETGHALVGRQVRKYFPGYDWYDGVVEDYNAAEDWCAPCILALMLDCNALVLRACGQQSPAVTAA